MRRAKTNTKKSKIKQKKCEERIACVHPEDLPAIKCTQCSTFQCNACEEELHRDGEYFFHERICLDSNRQPFITNTSTPQQVNGLQQEKSSFDQVEPLILSRHTTNLASLSPGKPTLALDIPTSDLDSTESSDKSIEATSSSLEIHSEELFRDALNEANLEPLDLNYHSSEDEYLRLTVPSETKSKTDSNMRPNKKSKKKKSIRYGEAGSEQSKSIDSLNIDESNDSFTEIEQTNLTNSMTSDYMNDERVVSDLMESMHENLNLKTRPRIGSFCESVHLIDEHEELKVESEEELAQLLECFGRCKVVSIFGNAGVGKSYSLNQIFFGSEEVFRTSPNISRCTAGVHVAYNRETSVLCMDTEGLLGVSANTNRRRRFLLKVLAMSDVVVYRTNAERGFEDMLQFLNDGSISYERHFQPVLLDLESSSSNTRKANNPSYCSGPALVIFHETSRTDIIKAVSTATPEDIIRDMFERSNLTCAAYHSIDYVGTQTTQPPTDFSRIQRVVMNLLADTTVRTPRSIAHIYNAVKALNDKFNGEINCQSSISFASEFFTCETKCLSCMTRCASERNHSGPHCVSAECQYNTVYDNKIYICKHCYMTSGDRNVVVPKTAGSKDNQLVAVAMYAWSGYILECKTCGVIYRERQKWYGNDDPTQEKVLCVTQHIWPGEAPMLRSTHNAARKLLDGVSKMATTVTEYSSKPMQLLGDWVTDQLAPPYWVLNSLVTQCYTCKKPFKDQEKKHHCRACGQGFCDECTQYYRPVPARGWETPVRTCKECFENTSQDKPGVASGDNSALLPRQAVETMRSAIGTVASVAFSYPMEIIKDSARPAYWVPDHLIEDCSGCQEKFGPKLTIHHCRACGKGVCADCSKNRRYVPSRGWDKNVRVCDCCFRRSGSL